MDEKRHLYEALTRWNYFPNQKNTISEMPPCFSTRTFTPEIAENLVLMGEPKSRKLRAYDHVDFSATRHNNVPRMLALIHPKAYSFLAKAIHDNWDAIQHIKQNERSAIKPEIHDDGRIMIMNYEDPDIKASKSLHDGFGCKFRVQTDITSCFNSIYTHAIPWAIVGFEEAKKSLDNREEKGWHDLLDKYQRRTKRNETLGIPIGPATSSVIVELILGRVDQKLVDKNFQFIRHIDDYVCFCKTYEQAQDFLQTLSYELSLYKLTLNLHKTSIVELPCPISDGWVASLNSALPNTLIDDNYGRRKLLSSELMQFLDFAVILNKETADGSVIKYAVGAVIHHVSNSHLPSVFGYILNLSWHFPILLPYLDTVMSKEGFDCSSYGPQLNEIVLENAKHRRSDGMTWPLYLLKKHNLPIEPATIDAVIRSKDCCAILCMYDMALAKEQVLVFAKEKLTADDYDKDKYWLLLYQIYLKEDIDNPYEDDVCFEYLKSVFVNFMPDDVRTKAEQYCEFVFDNPFSDPNTEMPTFEDWLKMP